MRYLALSCVRIGTKNKMCDIKRRMPVHGPPYTSCPEYQPAESVNIENIKYAHNNALPCIYYTHNINNNNNAIYF